MAYHCILGVHAEGTSSVCPRLRWSAGRGRGADRRSGSRKGSGSAVDRVVEQVGPGPWFVKPVRGGSSLGIGRAEHPVELHEAYRWDTAALVEEEIPHRELVLGNPGFTCPAGIDPHLAGRAQELAAEAFGVLGCDVFARVDLFLDRRTGELLVNEVNAIPGMTEVSVLPKVMHAAGYGYSELLTELCRLACDR